MERHGAGQNRHVSVEGPCCLGAVPNFSKPPQRESAKGARLPRVSKHGVRLGGGLLMRLPWLQVNADGLTRSRLLARLLGVHEMQGAGMALALWAWALEMSPEGDFSGVVVGDKELLAAACDWPSDDAPRLITALQRVGFIATAPALRVRGLDRYRRTWEKNQKRFVKPATFGDRVPETGATRAGLAPEPARKTETETEKKQLPSVAPLKRVRPVDPRYLPMVARLLETFKTIRGVEYAFGGADGNALKVILPLGSDDEIDRRWRVGLTAGKYAVKAATVSQLRYRWNELTGEPSTAQTESLAL